VDIGNWDKSTGVVFSEGALEAIVWPTEDNSKPVYDASWTAGELNMGFLHPFYTLDGESYHYSSSGHNNLVGSIMALEEINANPDLLPDTVLKFEVMDTRHDAGTGLAGAFHLATDAFEGKGADVVVGAAYSGVTTVVQNVLKNFGTPQVSRELDEGNLLP